MVLHVCDFIRTLPTTVSHHSREKYPNRRFVPPGFSHHMMHVAYLDWVVTAHPQDVGKVTLSKFTDIMNKGFNISKRYVIL